MVLRELVLEGRSSGKTLNSFQHLCVLLRSEDRLEADQKPVLGPQAASPVLSDQGREGGLGRKCWEQVGASEGLASLEKGTW